VTAVSTAEVVMSTTHRRPAELWVLMQFRRLGFGGNPLRRGADRVESVLVLGTVLLALLAVPAAAALGTAVRNASEHSAAQRRAELHQVQARTVEDTPTAVPVAPGQVGSRVRVAWVDEAGFPQEGRTDVVIGTNAGTEVTIWLDRHGSIGAPPRQPADNTALGAAAGLTAVMLAWPLLWGLFRLARIPLDRRRARDWAREWEQVAPRWKRTEH
jgi:hypothetical protein